MSPLAQLGKGHDADSVIPKHSGNELVAQVAARRLAFGNSKKLRVVDSAANSIRGKREQFRLARIAPQRHRMHEASRAIAAVRKIDAHGIAWIGKLSHAHAPALW